MILQADIIIFLLSRENPCMQSYVFVLGLVDAISIADSRAEGRSSRTQNIISSFLLCSFIGYALYVEKNQKPMSQELMKINLFVYFRFDASRRKIQ